MRNDQKRAVVVGAGIVGLASACRLAEAGYAVTVVEQADGPGAGSSNANAGQLLFDRVGAFGSPGFLRSLPATLLDRQQGVGAAGLLHPSRWGWSAEFLRHCTTAAWRRNTRALLELAHLSAQGMGAFRDRHAMAFDWRRPGKLISYGTQAGLEQALQVAEFQAQFGGVHHRLSAEECFALEPALRATTRAVAGAVYLPDAEVGDCHACCQELARVLCQDLGGTLRYGLRVSDILREGGRVVGVRAGGETTKADLFVLATGRASGALLRGRFKGKKPIVGVKGVSLTFPRGDLPPDLSVTDASGKFVVLRLGDRVRVTGYGIFTDDLTVTPAQVRALVGKARGLMPEAADWQAAPVIWGGLRPQTPDDLPMICRAGADNLYVNAGHGSLGWTLAFGSAERLLAVIAG